jgi:predicted alpha/beta hydrolase family esterase
MQELEKQDVYACALPMPTPEAPAQQEWVDEIERILEMNKNDEIYLVGHSLGSTAILRYLENTSSNIAGVVLVSGPIIKTMNRKINNFFKTPFDFKTVKTKSDRFVVIHGDNDPYVPITDHGDISSKALDAHYIVIKNGQHLNGSAGYHVLPECLEVLNSIME